MTQEAVWYKTQLPLDVINSFLEETSLEEELEESTLNGKVLVDSAVRNSRTAWVPNTNWIAGFCYHFILKANEENFKFNIKSFGDRFIQYTSYEEGHYYNWHTDSEYGESDSVRKLSFSLQLSEPTDYTGGQLEFLTDNDHRFMAPRNKGAIVIFDSRVRHRVRKITSGHRKSLVGWIEGPQWK
jgi:PKHD-type hydroxylase